MYKEKEALEYLVGLGEVKTIEIGGHTYATKGLNRVKELNPEALQVTTLTALIDYIKNNLDQKAGANLLIHVTTPESVTLYSELRADKERECYMVANALLPRITFERFLDREQFNIMMQSNFVGNEDKETILKVIGTIQDKAVKEVGDDGVTQAVTIKTGVAQVGDAYVPNPVTLAPYRTFPEITQVESKFIFRMKEGPTAALFEADGGAWRNETMKRIKEYLVKELTEFPNVKVIS